MQKFASGCGDKKTFDILSSSGVIRVKGTHGEDINSHIPLDFFDTDRHIFVEEDADIRVWCKEALLSLINWRSNNPFADDMPSEDQNSTTSSVDSEEEVFYDFDEELG